MSIFKQRINKLQKKLEKINVDVAIITNEDNVYYLTGYYDCLLYTSPSPRDRTRSRMPSSA